MGLPLPLDPTPKSVEAIVARLPARDRAQLDWFPVAFRQQVVAPLRAATSRRLVSVLEEVVVDAARMFLRLAAATAKLLEEPSFALLIDSPTEDIHDRIRRRLEMIDPTAADDLREASEWLRAILSALLSEFRAELAFVSRAAPDEMELSDEDMRRELRGSGGALFRGLVLTVAAVEALDSDRSLPDGLSRWCEVARLEVNAAANALRADGVAVPTAVTIPGVSPTQWRARRSSLRIRREVLPAGVMDRLLSVLNPEEIWLFGSRGRGTHAPGSDWDLLVVLPDRVDLERAEASSALAPLRRQRVDLVLVGRTDFETNRESFGTLVNEAVTRGYQIHAH